MIALERQERTVADGSTDNTIFYANFYESNEGACKPAPVRHFLGLYADSIREKAQLVTSGNIVGNPGY